MLRVDRRTVINWILHAGLPAIRVRNRYRISEVELQKWLESNVTVSTTSHSEGFPGKEKCR